MPFHWWTYMFEVRKAIAGPNSSTGSYLEFSRGGFQGGEGMGELDEHNEPAIKSSNWYIENVFEEIDSPREWFYNETTRVLYYMPNASATGTLDANGLPTGSFVATDLKVLINITGSKSKPVANVTIAGLTLRDTSYTYMDPHG
jgi:hypothetical protein